MTTRHANPDTDPRPCARVADPAGIIRRFPTRGQPPGPMS
ncbi:hypothetical protein TVNIR_2377 [Thioalkalivibrio nitratireducens DSM 14787]|uniref:Uncharacterized protein n=1 Tax=Thioalkalivibrio nitratireducens (strain DSM 14787 / UNIQEM 213 / ALEN2) TaxID=1255043 RepID=L0DYI0_THIND|nr:hypothetical protein TVNIR_2377 [Thioalkalivibrio nitratireducens DSM 14787]